MPIRLPLLDDDPEAPFPPIDSALNEPDGLLAMGGDLSPTRLLKAYRSGIFPWFSEGQPILWWSPDPRMLFRTDRLYLSSRLRRFFRQSGWIARADSNFAAVIAACADTPRPGQAGTWITAEMRVAYQEMHRLGHAHSVEVYAGESTSPGDLVGGIYGVTVGRMFFGESMVSLASGGSKAALAALAHRLQDWGWPLLDTQIENPHLRSLGAEVWPRVDFEAAIAPLCASPVPAGSWSERFGALPVRDLGLRTTGY